MTSGIFCLRCGFRLPLHAETCWRQAAPEARRSRAPRTSRDSEPPPEASVVPSPTQRVDWRAGAKVKAQASMASTAEGRAEPRADAAFTVASTTVNSVCDGTSVPSSTPPPRYARSPRTPCAIEGPRPPTVTPRGAVTPRGKSLAEALHPCKRGISGDPRRHPSLPAETLSPGGLSLPAGDRA